jgi:hypothetical protein
MTSIPTPVRRLHATPVPTLRDATDAQLDAAVETRRPFVVSGRLPARTTWDIDQLAGRLAHRDVPVQASPNGRFFPDPESGFETRTVTLGDYHRYLTDPSPAEHLYMMHMDVGDVFGDMAPEIARAMALPGRSPSPIRVWIGRGGTVTPMHHDLPSNWLMQVAGEKLVMLAPPDALPQLEPYSIDSRWANYSAIDFDDLDDARAARLRDVPFQVATLGPGDALCVPSFWLHYVRTETTGISVNRWWQPPVSSVPVASLGRLVAGVSMFGRSERIAEFLDFGGERPTPRWLPERLWAAGHHAYAVVAAGSALAGVDAERARELVALARTCRNPAQAPPAAVLAPVFDELLALIGAP